MRKLTLLFFLVLASSFAFSQGSMLAPQTALKTVNGQTYPIPNATITVCGANTPGIPCNLPLSNVAYADRALTIPLGNPFNADANGNYQFAAIPASYTVTVTAPGFAGYSYQVDTPGGGGSTSGVQYGFAGGYQVNLGTNGRADAIQTFPCDPFFCTAVIGSYSIPPAGGVPDGSIGITPASFSSALPHLSHSFNGIFYPELTANDSVCDLTDTCTGNGPVVKQSQPLIFSPNFYNPVTNNLTIRSFDGDFFDIQPGGGMIIAGSVTSGTFQSPVNNVTGEGITQTSTGAQATFILIEPSGAMLVSSAILGSPDNSHTWVGNNSGAVFTPTATPAVPYCQDLPTAGHEYGCFGSDGKFQISNDAAPNADVLLQGPYLPSDFTTANNTSFQKITAGGTTLSFSKQAKAAVSEFHCVLMYFQATANATVSFGIQAETNTPTNINASGDLATSTTAKTSGTLNNSTPSAASPVTIVGALPSAFGSSNIFRVVLDGTIEDGAHANIFDIMVATATGADAVTIKRGSFCSF